MSLQNLPDTNKTSEPAAKDRHSDIHGVEFQDSFFAHPSFSEYMGEPLRKSRKGKVAAIVAVLLCALVGAGVALAMNMPPQPESEPVPEQPAALATLQATVKADDVFIEDVELMRGDQLTRISPAAELSGGYADLYYRATLDGQVVYVEKKWVRTTDESAPEEWVGYAAADAMIYQDASFQSEEVLTLQLNEEVTVLDSFNDILFVRNADGYEGYMPPDKVLQEKVVVQQDDSAKNPGYYNRPSTGGTGSSGKRPSGGGSSSGGGGSSGGGAADSGGSNGGSSGGSSGGSTPSTSGDGDEMAMPVSFDELLFGVGVAYADEPVAVEGVEAPTEVDAGLTGVVLADGIIAYSCILNRGDVVTVKGDGQAVSPGEVEVVSRDDSFDEQVAKFDVFDKEEGSGEDTEGREDQSACLVLINEREVEIPKELLRLENDRPYDAWDGFAVEGAVLYSDYLLDSVSIELAANDSIHVVDAIGDTLVVDMDGAYLYTADEQVSETEIVVEEPVAVEEPAANSEGQSTPRAPAYSKPSSGSSGGSSKPSTPSAPEPEPEPSTPPADTGSGDSAAGDEGEWTPPKL